jgi:hypothetical protein
MTETLILGLAAIVCSTSVSCVGLYFVYRARSQPFRERLYEAQLALLSEIAEQVVELNSLCLQARVQTEDARRKTFIRAAEPAKRFATLGSRAPVVLPLRICIAITAYGKALQTWIRTQGTDTAALAAVVEACHGLFDQIRECTGVDPMSAETLRLFSASTAIETTLKVEPRT